MSFERRCARAPRRRTTTSSRPPSYRLVDAFERHSEFKVAWYGNGDKHYQESRGQLVTALVDFGREIVRAVLVTGRG